LYILNVTQPNPVIFTRFTLFYLSGRQFNAKGDLKNWWTKRALAEFKNRTACLANWFQKFSAAGNRETGQQTVGENIADGGGLRAAYTVIGNCSSSSPLPLTTLQARLTTGNFAVCEYREIRKKRGGFELRGRRTGNTN